LRQNALSQSFPVVHEAVMLRPHVRRSMQEAPRLSLLAPVLMGSTQHRHVTFLSGRLPVQVQLFLLSHGGDGPRRWTFTKRNYV
jgi:hypothetical protein